jgi:prolyl oligopeptidase
VYRQALRNNCRLLALVVLPAAWTGAPVAYPQTRAFDPKNYPDAKRGDTVDVLHGKQVADPYRWLEDEQSDQTQAWLDAQDQLTQITLARLDSLKRQVAAELEAVYGVDSVSNIRPYGNRYYFTRRAGLENHAKVYVRENDYHGEPKVAINPKPLARRLTDRLRQVRQRF